MARADADQRYERERQGDRTTRASWSCGRIDHAGAPWRARWGCAVPRPDRGRAILSHGYDRLYELFAVLVFSLPAAFLLLGWAGRLVSLGIVATYGVGIAMAQSAYWRSKFGGFSLLRKVPKLDALLSTIIATSPVYWMLSITYFLTGYLLLMCFIVGIGRSTIGMPCSFYPW